MKSSRKRLLKKIFANVTVGLFIVAFFGNSIAGQFSGQINSFLGTSTTQIVGEDAGEYVRYYESEFGSIAELKAAGLAKAEEVEAEGAVLLKNNGILPLDPKANVAVIGPNADDKSVLLGNYNGTPSQYTTLLRGIQEAAQGKVRYARGCHIHRAAVGQWEEHPLREAILAAQKSDVVILCMGLNLSLIHI